MSHEIYYTSAPEGLKRGTSGFCTVAASPDIPKPLWDRLETLSAYRHHFAMNASSDQSGENPVSHAHWILNIAGKTSHVLSRICDSGVDHTQRTNAFAHHLVLDHTEIARATGGPAALLKTPGIMAETWDGQVGLLNRASLPTVNDAVPAICRRWANATGDPGWGGHLADLFVKSPTRPVCILFSPDHAHQMLDLLAESIALLPPAARWNVTFNTYFTSMPTSATCLWRCCLAGTPAAQIGLRYAAAGLILDLTGGTPLPTLPDGTYVNLARTGQQKSATPARPAPPTPTRPGPIKAPPAIKHPPIGGGDDDSDLYEFEPPGIEETPPPTTGTTFPPTQAEYGLAEPTPPRPRRPAPSLRRADDALIQAQQEAEEAAARRRKQIMFLFIGALAAIGIGTALIFMLNGRSTPPPPPAPEQAVRPPEQTQQPPTINPIEQPIPTPTQTNVVVVVPPEQPQPTTTDVTPAPEITYPEKISLAAALTIPNPGTGLSDVTQTFPLRAADFDPRGRVTNLRLHLPRKSADPAPADSTPMTFTLPNGTLSAVAETRGAKPTLSLRWRATGDPAAPVEALAITLDRAKPSLDFQWRSAILLKNPGIISLLYWTLHNSTLQLEAANRTPETGLPRQAISLRPISFKPFDYTASSILLTLPAPLPADTKAAAPPQSTLPTGWEAAAFTNFENKDDTLRRADNATQVITLKMPANTFCWFNITLTPGMTKIESTYTHRLETVKADLAKTESSLQAKLTEITNQEAMIRGTGSQQPVSPDLIRDRDQAIQLIEQYKSALAGYKELSHFDVALELEGVPLTTLQFQKPTAAPGN